MSSTLYVSDLDGTLLGFDSRLSEYTITMLNRLHSEGMLFTYATARSYETAKRVTGRLKLHVPVIVYNGTFIIDEKTGSVVSGQGFAAEEIAEITEILREETIYPLVYAFVSGVEKVSWHREHVNTGMTLYFDIRQGDRRFRPVGSEEALYTGDIFYFTCIGEEEQMRRLYRQVDTLGKYTCTLHRERPGEFWFEIMPLYATKANAAKRLKELLGCDKIVAFGDETNDLPLFQVADEAYAVENAVESLKNQATGIIGSNEGDGVAKWLAHHWRK